MEHEPEKQPVIPPLNAKVAAWRKKMGLTLHATRDLIGLSVGHICDLENGKEPVTPRTFRKYHDADPAFFPLSDAGLMI